MPVFESPKPITATIDVAAGAVRLVASERTDTEVEVRPTDPTDPLSARAAATTTVEFHDGRLTVGTPKAAPWTWKWAVDLVTGPNGVEVVVELPTGSDVRVQTGYGDIRAEGEFGECRLRTSYGGIELDRAATAELTTTGGSVDVAAVAGRARAGTGTGDLRIGDVGGPGTFTNDYGRTSIGRVAGELRLTGSYGDMTVRHAGADVEARTAYGSVTIDEVVRGTVSLTTTSGRLEVGVREGTAAWLDVRTTHGTLRNSLPTRGGPDGFTDTVEIHASTRDGDIVIRRS
jgi:DUF4097 and DUF4098 domain-containing protein YvlB